MRKMFEYTFYCRVGDSKVPTLRRAFTADFCKREAEVHALEQAQCWCRQMGYEFMKMREINEYDGASNILTGGN